MWWWGELGFYVGVQDSYSNAYVRVYALLAGCLSAHLFHQRKHAHIFMHKDPPALGHGMGGGREEKLNE